MTSDLTPRQKSVLEFIIAFQQEHRMAPTVREICAHLGLKGSAGIHRILNILKDKGYILAEPGKKRTWRFSKEVTGRGIPLIGTIAAGQPLEAIQRGPALDNVGHMHIDSPEARPVEGRSHFYLAIDPLLAQYSNGGTNALLDIGRCHILVRIKRQLEVHTRVIGVSQQAEFLLRALRIVTQCLHPVAGL